MSHHALNQQQFFHVSPHELEPGTELKPGGGQNFEDAQGVNDWVRSHVSMARGQASALEWGAVIGAGRHSVMHLYHVEPSEPPEERDSGFYGMSEHVAPSARVVRKVRSFDPSEE